MEENEEEKRQFERGPEKAKTNVKKAASLFGVKEEWIKRVEWRAFSAAPVS